MSALRASRRKPVSAPENRSIALPATEGALAIALIGIAAEAGTRGVVYVSSSESRAERLAGLIWRLAPNFETIILPAWDSLPYDRSPPSRRAMGRRIAAVAALAEPATRPRLVLAVPEALLQLLAPYDVLREATQHLAIGESIELEGLSSRLERIGYVADERVDEPGEFALRGQVLDIYPAGFYVHGVV
jgi:transcription-repair coupling factor (superfamily II helicase)